MNLIERLGGYLQAKALRALPAATYDCGVRFSREELECAMLDHRRQHNIFEVGDKVLEISDDCEMSILTVNSISSKIMVCVNDGLDASCCLSKYSPSFYVRHATDEEIKAGRRL